ncbi:MAG: hypothetical protein ACRD16_02795 [Thermoanaerobaculia bacterium]
MNTRSTLFAGVILGAAAVTFGQNSTTYEKTQTDGSVTTTTRTSFSGPVVSYEPGHTIVLREDGRTVSYMLSPSAEIPSDVAVGKVVTITTSPDSRTVTRVVTTDTDMRGEPRQTTVTREESPSGSVTTTRETTTYGTVSSYDAGRSLTITDKHGKRVTYIVTDQSQLPTSVRIGKKVRIYTIPASNGSEQVVKRVTVTTETNPPE